MTLLSHLRPTPGINSDNLVQRDSFGYIQETRTFIANGDIDEGSFVALRSEGEVEKIQQFDVPMTQATNHVRIIPDSIELSGTRDKRNSIICHHTIRNTLVMFYSDNSNNDYGTVALFNINQDESITPLGSPEIFNNGTTKGITTSFNVSTNTIVCVYLNGSVPRARIISIDGATINMGTPVDIMLNPVDGVASGRNIYHVSHESKPEFIVVGNRDNVASTPTNFVHGIIGTINEMTITFGNTTEIMEQPIINNVYRNNVQVEYDPSSEYYVVAVGERTDHNAYIIYCRASEGSNVIDDISEEKLLYEFSGAFTYISGLKYHPDSKSVIVIISNDNNNIQNRKSIAIALRFYPNANTDGSHIIQSTDIKLLTTENNNIRYGAGFEYDPISKKMVLVYRRNDAGPAYYMHLSIFDNAIINSDEIEINGNNHNASDIELCYDRNSRKIVAFYAYNGPDETDSGLGYTSLIEIEGMSTNADKWIGVAEHSANDSEEVNIRTFSGTSRTNQTGLIPGERYFLDDKGLLTKHPLNGRYVGVAETSSSIIMTTNSVEQDNIPKYYTLPSFDGDSSQALKTDGNGNVSWRGISNVPDYVGYFDGTNSTNTNDFAWHGHGNITITKPSSNAHYRYRLTFPTSYTNFDSYIVQLTTSMAGDASNKVGIRAQVNEESPSGNYVTIDFVQGPNFIDPIPSNNGQGPADNNQVNGLRCYVTIFSVS